MIPNKHRANIIVGQPSWQKALQKKSDGIFVLEAGKPQQKFSLVFGKNVLRGYHACFEVLNKKNFGGAVVRPLAFHL